MKAIRCIAQADCIVNLNACEMNRGLSFHLQTCRSSNEFYSDRCHIKPRKIPKSLSISLQILSFGQNRLRKIRFLHRKTFNRPSKLKRAICACMVY